LYGEITGRRQLRLAVAVAETVALAVAVAVGVCRLPVDPLAHPVTSTTTREQRIAFLGVGIRELNAGRPLWFRAPSAAIT
jgi:hypothetical protein